MTFFLLDETSLKKKRSKKRLRKEIGKPKPNIHVVEFEEEQVSWRSCRLPNQGNTAEKLQTRK
ncbi:hypothetical protein SESBI_47325 [Sesbania bispinosa]|nr:hypothetical protein SESBI_47325 [Sesbania bispinosa]